MIQQYRHSELEKLLSEDVCGRPLNFRFNQEFIQCGGKIVKNTVQVNGEDVQDNIYEIDPDAICGRQLTQLFQRGLYFLKRPLKLFIVYELTQCNIADMNDTYKTKLINSLKNNTKSDDICIEYDEFAKAVGENNIYQDGEKQKLENAYQRMLEVHGIEDMQRFKSELNLTKYEQALFDYRWFS